MRTSLQLAKIWLHGWRDVPATEKNGLVVAFQIGVQIHVHFKGIFPWIVTQSQGTEDKRKQAYPKVSLSEILGTIWLWVSAPEPVEEEAGFWSRQIRPKPDLFAFVHQVLFCFVSGIAAVYIM